MNSENTNDPEQDVVTTSDNQQELIPELTAWGRFGGLSLIIGTLLSAFAAIGLTIASYESHYHPLWVACLISFGLAGLVVTLCGRVGGDVPGDVMAVTITLTLFFLIFWSVFLRVIHHHQGGMTPPLAKRAMPTTPAP